MSENVGEFDYESVGKKNVQCFLETNNGAICSRLWIEKVIVI